MFSDRKWPVSLLIFGVISCKAFCQAPARDGKIKVAIYPFDQSTVQANIQKEVGANVNYGQVAADLLVSALSQQVDVINRDQVKRLLEEQGRRYDEHFDASQAPEFGKLLGVDAIVTGSITSLSVEEQSSKGGGRIPGIRLPILGNASKKVNVEVMLTSQMISTATGKTLGAPQATGTARKATGSQLTVSGATNGGNTSSKSGPDAQIRDALKDAVGQLGADFPVLISRLAEQPMQSKITPLTAVPAPSAEYIALADEVGNIGKVQGDSVVFFLAPDAHVKVGETLEVEHPDFTKNPRTGKTVAIGNPLGTLNVSEVAPDHARGTYAGKPVTDQDRVVKRTVTAKQ